MPHYRSSSAKSRFTIGERAMIPLSAIEFSQSASRACRTLARSMKQNEADCRGRQTALAWRRTMKMIQKRRWQPSWPLSVSWSGSEQACRPSRAGSAAGASGMRGGFAGLGQLGLSDEQRQEVRRIMELHKAEQQSIGQRLRDAHRAQAEAVMAVPVDEAAVRARSAELAKVESRRGRSPRAGARRGLQRAHPGTAGEGEGAARGTRAAPGAVERSERPAPQAKP